MARIRSIKPDFFTSLTVTSLSVHARLTFAGLWTHADDEGRCLNEPRLIKAALWPLDDSVTAGNVAGYIDEMAARDLVAIYVHEGREYLQIIGWAEHQSISKPKPSKLPAPDDPGSVPDHDRTANTASAKPVADVSDPRPGHVLDESSRERKGTGNREQGDVADDGDGQIPDEPVPDFDEFWTAYPRHHQTGKIAGGGARAPALKRWDKLNPDEKQACLVAVRHYATAMTATGEYVKHPEGWLHERRWEDWQEPPPLRHINGRDDAQQVIV